MSEYLAAMTAPVAIMFFYSWVSFKLGPKHDGFKLFLVLASFVMSWAVLHLGTQTLLAVTPATALENAAHYTYYLGIVIGALSMVYFAVFYVFGLASSAAKRKRFRVTGDDD